jgi:hypothetical protein
VVAQLRVVSSADSDAELEVDIERAYRRIIATPATSPLLRPLHDAWMALRACRSPEKLAQMQRADEERLAHARGVR